MPQAPLIERVTRYSSRITPDQKISDRYQVIEFLGAGGMGEVWKTYDPIRSSAVALKVLPAELAANPEDVEAFQESFQRIQGIFHQFICPVHEFNWDSQVGPYLVMAFIEGQILRTHLRNSAAPLPLDRVIQLISPIAVALDHAHQSGIVHRDVKPENIMVTSDGTSATLLDFGIASTIRRNSTRTGKSFGSAGTPAYLAPEQWQAEKATGKTDQYALGIVVYELLTGEPPYAEAPSDTVLARCHLEQPLPPHPKLSPAVHRVLSKACAKRAEDRFNGCAHFLQTLKTPELSATRMILPRIQSSSALPGARSTYYTQAYNRIRTTSLLIFWNALGLGLLGLCYFLYWPSSQQPSKSNAVKSNLPAANAPTPNPGLSQPATTSSSPTPTGQQSASTSIGTNPISPPAVPSQPVSPPVAQPVVTPKPLVADPAAIQAAKHAADQQRLQAERKGASHLDPAWKDALDDWTAACDLESKQDGASIAKFISARNKFTQSAKQAEIRLFAETSFLRDEVPLRREIEIAKSRALNSDAQKRAKSVWKEAESVLANANSAKIERKFDESRSLLGEAKRQFDRAEFSSRQAIQFEMRQTQLTNDTKDFTPEELQHNGGADWIANEQSLLKAKEKEDWQTAIATIDKMHAQIPEIRRKLTSIKLVRLYEEHQYESVLSLLWPVLESTDSQQREIFLESAQKQPQWFLASADALMSQLTDDYERAVALYQLQSAHRRISGTIVNAVNDAWFRAAERVSTAPRKADAQLFALENSLNSNDARVVKERHRSVAVTISKTTRNEGIGQYYSQLSGLCMRAGLKAEALEYMAAGMSASSTYLSLHDPQFAYPLVASHALGNQSALAIQLLEKQAPLGSLGLPLTLLGLANQQLEASLAHHIELQARANLATHHNSYSFASIAYWSAAGKKDLKDAASGYRVAAKTALASERREHRNQRNWTSIAEVYLAVGDLKEAISESKGTELSAAVDAVVASLMDVKDARELSWGLMQSVPLLLSLPGDRSNDVERLIARAAEDPRARSLYRNLLAYRAAKASSHLESIIQVNQIHDPLCRICAMCGIAEGLARFAALK